MAPPPPLAPLASNTALAVLAYSACSGSLLLVNKVVMAYIPSAPLVTALQCIFCVSAIGSSSLLFGAPQLGRITDPALLRAYALYSALFVVGIYTNMRSLESSNVDTVIVFRSAVPLIVAFGDWALMGREAPSARSLASMVVVLLGCAAFVAVDAAFVVQGLRAYVWVSLYVASLAAEMLFGKQITSAHGATLGASVLLTNGFAFAPFLALGAWTGELARGLDAAHFTAPACAVLAASCALSAGIGFSSWWARSLLSATTFTVVGQVNKVLTVLLNIALWNKHASPLGTAFLFVCLAGGAAYQQAPMRAGYAKVESAETKAEARKEGSGEEGGA
jgi:GDP-mannose transporter